MERIPYDGTTFFMIRAVSDLEGNIAVGAELPDIRQTVEEATECAKELRGVAIVFQVTPILKVVTREVATVRQIGPRKRK